MGTFSKIEFGKTLELAKGSRSINQYSKESGVSSAHISRLIRGLLDIAPNPNIIEKLAVCAHNNVTYEDLMETAGHIEHPMELNSELINEFIGICQELNEEQMGLLLEVAKQFKR